MHKEKIAIVSDLNVKELKNILKKFKNFELFDIFYTNKSNDFSFYNYLKTIYKIENLDLSNYKTVISFSTGIAHGIITNIDTNHINFQISYDTELYEADNVFLKQKFRIWQAISLVRPNKNYCFTDAEKSMYEKLNRSSNFKKSKIIKTTKINYPNKNLSNEQSEYFYLFTNKYSNFSSEIINIFNKTGKKLFIITTPKLKSKIAAKLNPSIKISSNLKTIDNARGIIIDSSFRSSYKIINAIQDINSIAHNKNIITEELFKNAFSFDDDESIENQLSKFVSLSKLQQVNTNLKYELDFNSLDF